MSLRANLGFSSEPLYLMDGSAFVFRGFYAFQNMARSDGFPTNSLYIVTRLILKLLREERPAHFAFVLDGKGPNFRHELFPAYKAQRSATPEALVKQLAPVREALAVLGVPVIVSKDCEADDCIASLAMRFREERPVVILGADKDLKQCLHENVVLWDPSAKDEKITTLADFTEENGMLPSSWPDYQALVGDSSDNIPGVPKVGPKTALELIHSFPTLEELFDRLAAVPPKIRPKLEGQRENALLYRQLTTLQCTACPTVGLPELTVQPMDLTPVLQFMNTYELRALAREVESMSRAGIFTRGPAPLEDLAAGASFIGKNGSSATGNGTGGDGPAKEPAAKKTGKTAAKPGMTIQTQGLLAGSTSGPQLVTPMASPTSTPAGAAVQGSLFTAAAPVAQSFTEVRNVEELPGFAAGKDTALALLPMGTGESGEPEKSGLLLASADWERLYTGPVDALVSLLLERMKTASLILVAPDSKTLCKDHAELRQLPVTCWFDLSLAAYLLSPEDRGYGWEQVAVRWGDQEGSGYSAQANPGLLALALHRFMAQQLAGSGLTDVFSTLELPLVPVLTHMEERGITVDREAFAGFLEEVQTDLDRLTGEIHTLAGRVFNIRSSQQLSDVLFTVLDLPKAGKTKGGATSTSQESLEKLTGKHAIIDALLEYRKLEKLRSTYLEPLPRLADEQGRIHTTFNQTATATGRLSSSNPNLQNIPVRGPMGGRMRGCFIAAPGKSLVCADYSQIELRVLAHLSGDPTLLDAFRNNEDIHSRTAGLLFEVPIDQVTPEQRRNAKTINFGLVYGMGAQKLAQELHISMKEAKEFIERYFARLARLKEFYDTIEEEAKQHGFVATMTGRRRLTPDINSQNNQLRSQARRQAINTRIQGSAADIIKLAMIAVEKDPVLASLEARLLLQIHDELLLEAPQENAQAAGERLALLMSSVNPGAAALTVPLLVDWGTGQTWAEAH